ncbi:MAG: hypothetical protein HYR60_19010 [Acidobacteria bacterium]|nr:hypothetical protein [Acidobacteriota bacterium]
MNRREWLGAMAAAALQGAQSARQPTAGSMDSHFHSGKEREIPLPEWVDLAAAKGRRALVLIDHLELYRAGEPPRRNYPAGEEGRRAFLRDVTAERKRRPDLAIYSGWEVFEGELDTGVEMDSLRMVDCLGWHISHLKGERPPDGSVLLKRAAQLRELQKKLPIPMMLFHPFSPRIEGLRRRGGDVEPGESYFHGDEQKRLADLLAGSNLFIEMNHSSLRGYWDRPRYRDFLVQAIRPLGEAGLNFTVGSDDHSLAHLRDRLYDPTPMNEACAVRPEQLRRFWEALQKDRA